MLVPALIPKHDWGGVVFFFDGEAICTAIVDSITAEFSRCSREWCVKYFAIPAGKTVRECVTLYESEAFRTATDARNCAAQKQAAPVFTSAAVGGWYGADL